MAGIIHEIRGRLSWALGSAEQDAHWTGGERPGRPGMLEDTGRKNMGNPHCEGLMGCAEQLQLYSVGTRGVRFVEG